MSQFQFKGHLIFFLASSTDASVISQKNERQRCKCEPNHKYHKIMMICVNLKECRWL